jgi:adenosylcobyric acid synthase
MSASEPGARAVMLAGTVSHAGKTVLAAALCRIYARRGFRVAPFKAQNMSLKRLSRWPGLRHLPPRPL